MRLGAILCVPLGHRWHTARSDTSYPVLECDRCGARREATGGDGFDKRADLIAKTGLDPRVRR